MSTLLRYDDLFWETAKSMMILWPGISLQTGTSHSSLMSGEMGQRGPNGLSNLGAF